MAGYIITWDVDSRDFRQCTRVRRFVFGHAVSVDGKTYRYPGFVEEHLVTAASMGHLLPN